MSSYIDHVVLRSQGAGGGVAAGEGLPEERGPRGGEGRRGPPAVREGEHGRGSLPPQAGPADVRRVQRAEGRALRLLLLLLRPVRRRVRGQGRRPHARRRRAMGVSVVHAQIVTKFCGHNHQGGTI
jgi:hypothetical protein